MEKDAFFVSGFYRWNRIDEMVLSGKYAEFASAGTRFLTVDAETVKTFPEQPERMKRLCRIAAENGLIFRDSHAPWGEGFDLNELTEEKQIAFHETILRILAECGVKTCTFHIGAACVYRGEWQGREEHFRTVARKALERLLKCAEKVKITLAVENCFEPSTTAAEAMKLVREFPSPYLGLCLDCGHANLMEPRPERRVADMVNYIRKAWNDSPQFTSGIPEFMLPEIVTVHVHDNDGLNDKHTIIDSQGTIDWKRYSSLFQKVPRLLSLQSEVELSPDSDFTIPQVVHALQNIGR